VRVGLSLLTLVPGVVGGSERYVRELARALARVGRLEYHAFVPSIAPAAAAPLPATVVDEYAARRSTPGRIAAMARAALLPGPLLRRFEAERLDAIHFPLSVMLPRVERLPAATTVLDIQHEVFPEFFSRSELAYRKLVYGWTVRKSKLVITISEHARLTLIDRLGLEPSRVRAIYLAVDHEQFRPSEAERQPFLLYPANRWPHKNHDRLFEALALVRRERPELRLVLTGTGHDRRPVPAGVEVRGHVSMHELVALYQRAAALVYPSLYEGFGIPVIEAMACGCPVAVSRTASLPEVCGDAAEYFDPLSPDDIAAAVLRVLSRPNHYVTRGISHARQFTWDECARRHEAVYRELAGSG
jgi:glycosyltransferase involved in cell wall biosynthesis